MNKMDRKLEAFRRLLNIMDELREKCPWDREQTFDTLRNLTIEETYELAEAISDMDTAEIKKELGDLLLHIVFYARIGSEKGDFDIADVIDSLCEKLIYRHPHVYGDVDVQGKTEHVKRNWEELKQREGTKSVLSGVPLGLPAMIKANRVQEKVRAVGFDWDKREQIWDKVEEELSELKAELKDDHREGIEGEFGDLLFSIVNAARLYDIDPESALEKTNRKFIKRFRYLEDKTIGRGKSLREMNLEEMNLIWEEAKRHD
jgi:XTP/dITP diphosphohydrolase